MKYAHLFDSKMAPAYREKFRAEGTGTIVIHDPVFVFGPKKSENLPDQRHHLGQGIDCACKPEVEVVERRLDA